MPTTATQLRAQLTASLLYKTTTAAAFYAQALTGEAYPHLAARQEPLERTPVPTRDCVTLGFAASVR